MRPARSAGSVTVGVVERVFACPELLCHILSLVGPRTLLLSLCVSRTFNDIITGSPGLQQQLFFQPRLEHQGSSTLVSYQDRDHGYEPRCIRHVQFNPLLIHSFPNFFPKTVLGSSRTFFLQLDWNSNAAASTAYARDGASWRRMLVSDPPLEKATLSWSISSQGGGEVRKLDLLTGSTDGLRMGLLYDLVQEIVVEKGRFCSGSMRTEWGFAEAYTEEEWFREQRDWDDGVVAIEGEVFALEVQADHLYACVTSVGPPMAKFRSQAADLVDFESFERIARIKQT
jgi:hypothetical protein